MSAEDRYGVLVTLAGASRAKWLTSSGGTTAKRIHAATWNKGGAEAVAVHLVADNPAAVTSAKAATL